MMFEQSYIPEKDFLALDYHKFPQGLGDEKYYEEFSEK